jgi:glutamate carboxypeptidase
MRVHLHLLIFLAVGALARADALDPREQAIVAAVDADQARAQQLLEAAVNINSGTLNLAGVRRVGALFAREFEDIGFTTEWLPGDGFGRAGHLVARREGDGPKVLLIGHLDTVFPADSPFQLFERVDGDRARGPGITDMKGGDVIMVQALRALHGTGHIDELSFTVVLTGDEESAGKPLAEARRALVDAAKWADYAIGFEDGDSNPATAVVARRGSVGWELSVTGTAAHSSQIFQPDVGFGAIYEAARILDGIRAALSTEELLTINPGIVVGGGSVDFDAGSGGTAGGKDNIVAQNVRVSGDLRTISPTQLAAAQAEMQRIVAANLPGTTATIRFGEGYPPLAATDGNRELLVLFDEVSRDLGFGPVEPVNPRNAGAADVSFAAGLAPMIIDGVGLMGAGGHTVDEVADLRTLPMQTQRVAVLLYRLAQRK